MKNVSAQRPCPICGHDQAAIFSQLHFPLFNDTPIPGDVALASCAQCGFVYYDTHASSGDFDYFYRDHYLVRSYSLRKAHPAEIAFLDETVRILTSGGVSPKGLTVDVGCGPGHLLAHLKNAGFEKVLGLELCESYVEEMQTNGIPAQLASANDFRLPGEAADCLIFKNIFEHFLDFDPVLARIEANLKPDGHVFIEVPDAARYAEFPDYQPLSYLTLEHINHFDRSHMESLFSRHGFETVSWGSRMLDIAEKFPVPIQHILLRRTPHAPAMPESDFGLRDFLSRHVGAEARFRSPELESLRRRQTPTHVWGLSYRTLAWLGMSDLEGCNIVSFVDSDERKQQRLLRGKPITSPESLKDLSPGDTVVIGVGPSSAQMRSLLAEWGFRGEVITLH